MSSVVRGKWNYEVKRALEKFSQLPSLANVSPSIFIAKSNCKERNMAGFKDVKEKVRRQSMMTIGSERSFIPCNIAILTLSDTRTISEDKSGALLEGRVLKAGHILVDRKILNDDRQAISNQLRFWTTDKNIDVIINIL